MVLFHQRHVLPDTITNILRTNACAVASVLEENMKEFIVHYQAYRLAMEKMENARGKIPEHRRLDSIRILNMELERNVKELFRISQR